MSKTSAGTGLPRINGPLLSSTLGSVVFVGTNGVFQQDNTNFFWDDTNNYLGIGTNSPGSPIHLVRASVNDASEAMFQSYNSHQVGTIAADRFIRNALFSMTPNGTAQGGSRTLTIYGTDNSLNLGSIAIGTTGTSNRILGYGSYNDVSSAVTINNSNATQSVQTHGIWGQVSGTLAIGLSGVGTSSVFSSHGVYGINTASSPGHANLSAQAFGVRGEANGDLTTTGTTAHYGGYFQASGTADNNYGLYMGAVTSATNNFGFVVEATSTQTVVVSVNADNTTAAAGVAFGLSRDTNLYRSAADTLKTDDSFTVGTNLIVTGTSSFNGTVTVGDASSDAVTVNSNTWTFANDTNFVLSGGVNGMSIDSTTFSVDGTNHRVGIGTASPGTKLEINYGGNSTTNGLNLFSGGATNFMGYAVGRVTADGYFGVAGAANDWLTGTVQGDCIFECQTAGKSLHLAGAVSGGIPNLTLTSGGATFANGKVAPVLGTETFGVYGTFGVKSTAVNGYGIWINSGSAGTLNAGNIALFYNNSAATNIGSISTSGVNCLFNNLSDRRIKENITPSLKGLSELLKISVVDFNYEVDKSKQLLQGLIAQDIYTIYPDAVTPNGDNGIESLKDGDTPWAIDYGRMTPLIIKAIQDLNDKLDNFINSH